MASSEQAAFFTNSLYDKLKFVALVLLPALGTLYFAVAGIWHLPHTIEIVGTITAVDTFLGVVLHITTSSYYSNGQNFDGTMNVINTPEKQTFSLELTTPPEDLPGKHSVELNVNHATTQGGT